MQFETVAMRDFVTNDSQFKFLPLYPRLARS
jgi:hypothetical protein